MVIDLLFIEHFQDSYSNATDFRSAKITLPHSTINSPVFMPVGTQGTLKGLLPEQLSDMGYRMMLGNTYHLGHRPVHNGLLNLISCE